MSSLLLKDSSQEPAPQPSSLSETLHRLTHTYKSRLRETIKEKQIPLPITHIRALKGISRNPACTAHSIAQRMQRDKAQITRVLNELLKDGLIAKIDNPKDRRSQLLQLTSSGELIMAQLNAVEQQITAQMTCNLSEQDVAAFIRISNSINDNLSDQTLQSQPDNQSASTDPQV
ncbi:MarR family winged helix-turn-helix transcriptional regulator [Neptunomonas antarctica]|uniref:Transcriptional regulator, MarR family n=1 Tax=Neptunomonas antarctica TaxID=619304 RepID=A0A1N7LKL5_9GAMM|nr:MarR family transcriptional regulator [Neptunomonas antarctica]SIS74363.1 transcriptional regulator, MarR family [Neptunomonas antarctica]